MDRSRQRRRARLSFLYPVKQPGIVEPVQTNLERAASDELSGACRQQGLVGGWKDATADEGLARLPESVVERDHVARLSYLGLIEYVAQQSAGLTADPDCLGCALVKMPMTDDEEQTLL